MRDDNVSTEQRTYWQRLKDHPGVPHVFFWVAAGLVIAGKDDWRRGVVAAIVMLVTFGSIVLWTARR